MSTSAVVAVALVTASVICAVAPAASEVGESVPRELKLGAVVAVGAGVGAALGAGDGVGVAPATFGRRTTPNACQLGDVDDSVAVAATTPAGVTTRDELRMNELPPCALRAV